MVLDIEAYIANEGEVVRDNPHYTTKDYARSIARHHYMRLWDRLVSVDTIKMVKRLSAQCVICLHDRHTCLIDGCNVIAYQNRHKDMVLDLHDGPTKKKGVLQGYINQYGGFLGNDIRLYFIDNPREKKRIVGIVKDYHDGIVI